MEQGGQDGEHMQKGKAWLGNPWELRSECSWGCSPGGLQFCTQGRPYQKDPLNAAEKCSLQYDYYEGHWQIILHSLLQIQQVLFASDSNLYSKMCTFFSYLFKICIVWNEPAFSELNKHLTTTKYFGLWHYIILISVWPEFTNSIFFIEFCSVAFLDDRTWPATSLKEVTPKKRLNRPRLPRIYLSWLRLL